MFIILILSVSSVFKAFSNEHSEDTIRKSEKVLEQRVGANNLSNIKDMVIDSNLDLKISYEKLYQTQRQICLARAKCFSYGFGDAFIIYYTNAFSSLVLFELGTSLPSKWFNVRRTKYFKRAEEQNLSALKENIKNQVSTLYYGVLKDESVLQLADYELILMDKLFKNLRIQVDAGLIDEKEMIDHKVKHLRQRQEYLLFESYLLDEKLAFKNLLNKDFRDKIVLQPDGRFLSHDDISVDTETFGKQAQDRSYEIKASNEILNAAYAAKKSTKWSIMSFSGLGFDYLSKIRIKSSKIKDAIFRKKLISQNILLSTYSKESSLRISIDYLGSEKEMLEASKQYMYSKNEEFNSGKIMFSDLIKAKLYCLKDYKKMIVSHYNSLFRLDDLESSPWKSYKYE